MSGQFGNWSKIMVKKANTRNSMIELLRILSMFIIVIHHYAVHGTYALAMNSGRKIGGGDKAYLILHFSGRIGVTVFVLIGAYFLSAKRFNFKRPISLLVITFFYSWALFLAFEVVHPELVHVVLNGSIWFKTLVPYVMPYSYWFVNAYIVMLLLMPVLNLILKNLTQRSLLLLVIFLFVINSILPSLAIIFPRIDFSASDLGYSTGGYFLFIYLLAGYLYRKNQVGFYHLSFQ